MSQFFLEQNRLVVFVFVVISAILGLKLAIEKKTLTDTAWTGNSWDVVQFYMKNSVRFVKKGVRLVPLIFASWGGGCKNTYYNFDFTVTVLIHINFYTHTKGTNSRIFQFFICLFQKKCLLREREGGAASILMICA